jgi:hypothetical protein
VKENCFQNTRTHKTTQHHHGYDKKMLMQTLHHIFIFDNNPLKHAFKPHSWYCCCCFCRVLLMS